MLTLWKKLTTKPIWYLERHRSYPIREQVGELPSISCLTSGPILAVLTTPDTFMDSLWSAWSWLRFLADQVSLTIFVDGDILSVDRQHFGRLFPNGFLSTVDQQLKQYPVSGQNLDRFAREYRLGRKLNLVLSLQQRGPLIYSDFDVLVFGEPKEIISALRQNLQTCLFNQQPGDESYDHRLVERGAALGLTCPRDLNAGLMYIPEKSLSPELADSLLDGWQPSSTHEWFTEQTLQGLLLSRPGANPLPPQRYIVNMRRQFYWEQDVDYDSIAARHFVYPVRHVMHINGQPRLLSQAKSRGGAIAR